LEVRALDPYGNADASPASRSWAIEPPAQFRPGRYDLLSGSVFRNRGGVRRLSRDDGRRVEVAADEKRGGRFVSAFQAFASIAPGRLATLRSITLDYDGGASARGTAVKVHLFKFRTRRWVKVDGPTRTRRDRSFEWSPSAAPGDYVSSGGTVRIRVTGKGTDPFRTRTDLVRLIVEY
jgi:hypothetical protein